MNASENFVEHGDVSIIWNIVRQITKIINLSLIETRRKLYAEIALALIDIRNKYLSFGSGK